MSIVGTLGGALGGNPLSGVVGSVTQSVTGAGLSFIDAWVLNGTRSALDSVAHMIGVNTTPNLTSTWFSASYWRMAGLATLLTLPFLFAAAVHALLRSDLLLLSRAALVQLPLALLGVSLAAPVVMLLLAATDQMSALVAGPGVDGGAHFLIRASTAVGGASAIAGSPFLAIVVGLLTVAGALALMIELLIREAAVYVVVLMLPLAFAALVWPARRVWATRLLELLTALILSKFAIVAVLSLAGSALGHSDGVPQLLMAMTLVLLSCLAPWALLRLIPFTELGAAASESIRHHGRTAGRQTLATAGTGVAAADSALGLTGMLRRQAQADGQGDTDLASDEDPGVAPSQISSGRAADGYQRSGTDVNDGSSTGFASAGVLSTGPFPTRSRSRGPVAEADRSQADVSPDGNGPADGNGSADVASDAEGASETRWWEAEDMSLPGIHLGLNGLGGPGWVPPTNETGGRQPADASGVDEQPPTETTRPDGPEPPEVHP